MKNIKFLLLALLFIAAPSLKAQDIIITQEGDSHKVYEVEISASSVFYKLENKADAALLKMKKSDVLMIKFQDGRKVIMGEGGSNATAQSPTSETANEPTAPLTHSPEIIRKNQEWIEQYNKENTYTIHKPEDKQAKGLLCTLGYTSNSIIFTDDVKMEIEIGNMGYTENQFSKIESITTSVTPNKNLAARIRIINTSNNTVYIDLGNSFVTQFNGEAITMYTPSATTTTESKSGGVGVNLGAVGSALGVGGAAGTLAQGVNVGGGKTTGTSTVTYSQRIIAIPAKSSKIIGDFHFFPHSDYKASFISHTPLGENNAYLHSYKNINRGEKIIFNEEESPLKFTVILSYSNNENCQATQTLSTYLFLKEVLGVALDYVGSFITSKITPKANKNSLCFSTKNHKE